MRLKIGLLGIGKIARDQHIPSLKANSRFELAACASRNATVDGVLSFPDLESMLGAVPDLHCVSICHARRRFDAALMLCVPANTWCSRSRRQRRGRLHCSPKKPRRGLTLYQTWRSRYAAGVDAARDFLRNRKVTSGRIIWKEDVHHWHPGQRWIWEPGGFGVFDPGINALSLLTEILPKEVCVEGALLSFRKSAGTDRGESATAHRSGIEIRAEFDFRQRRATGTSSLRPPAPQARAVAPNSPSTARR